LKLLDRDSTNFFAPNTKALTGMLREIGFPKVDIIRNPGSPLPDPFKTPRPTRWEWLKENLGADVRVPVENKMPDRERHIAFAWRQ
jgi:hypothetical protein